MDEHDLDRGSEIFQDEVHNDELLDQYYRGFITGQDLLDRLTFLKQCADERVQDEAREEVDCMEARKEEIENALVDDGPWEAA